MSQKVVRMYIREWILYPRKGCRSIRLSVVDSDVVVSAESENACQDYRGDSDIRADL